MLNNKPLHLHLLLGVCREVSYFLAGMQYIMIKVGFLESPVYIAKLQGKRLYTLHCIWHARLTRRIISFLVRTPLRRYILKLVNFNIPMPKYQGCIIVTCHTPWKRLLIQWCLKKKFALIIGAGKWSGRRQIIQRQGAGLTELRELVKYLKLGGRVIVIVDVFNNLNNCPVKFLGNDYNASVFAERLATITKVPILTVVPKLTNTTIEFTAGPQFFTDGLKSKSTILTTEIISFFNEEIKNNPAIFSKYVK